LAVLALATPSYGDGKATERNLIYNGSFELGLLRDWWGFLSPNARFLPEHITDKDAAHGKRCLTFEGNVQFFSRYMAFEQAGEYRFQMFAKASEAGTLSVAFRAPPPPSPDNTASERVLASKSFPIAGKWQRYEVRAHLPQGQFALLISASSDAPNARFWFDAFELAATSVAEASAEPGKGDEAQDREEEGGDEFPEDGEKKPVFTAAFPLEAGLTSDVPGQIYYRNEEARAVLAVHNSSGKAVAASIQFEIRDLADQVVRTDKKPPVQVPAGQTVTAPFLLPMDTNGLFSLQYRLADGPGQVCEFVYAVIEKPGEQTILGAHTYADPYHLPVLQRAGVRWYVSLTDNFLRSVNVHPEPDRYVWDDARAKCLRDNGFHAIGVLEHAMFADWGPREQVEMETPVLMRGGYFEQRSYVKDDVWRSHVRAIASHYKDTIRRWIIDDEINAGWDPKSYLRILRSARETVREVVPDAEVTTSADVHFFEELVDLAGPDSFDAICGSIGNASIWEKRKTRFLAEKYGKPVWVNALFAYSRSAYRTHLGAGSLDRLERALGLYRHTVLNFFISRATYVSPYIFRLSKQSTTRPMPHSFLDYDGGLKPHGFGFIHAGAQLSALVQENLGALKLDSESPVEAYAFKGRGRTGVFLLGRLVVAFQPVEGLQITDWLGRQVKPEVKDGRVELSLDGGPAIVTAPAERSEEFLSAVGNLQAMKAPAPREMQATERFGYRDGMLVVEKHVTNESGQTVTIQTAADKSVALQPGQSTVIATPIAWNPARPLDNYLSPGGHRLWLHNCMKRNRAITIDGDLADWDDRSASWILMTWDILAFYSRRYMQLVDGGEHVSYNPRQDCKVGFRSAWDDSGVYFAVVVTDDSVPERGDDLDRVTIRLGGPPALEVPAGPHPATAADGNDQRSRSAWKRTPDGYQLEIAVLWPAEGERLGQVIPFDLSIFDTDEDTRYKGEERYRWGRTVMRWAGGTEDGGQLIFTAAYAAPAAPQVEE
jgi:hypothetical protein